MDRGLPEARKLANITSPPTVDGILRERLKVRLHGLLQVLLEPSKLLERCLGEEDSIHSLRG